MGYEVMLPLVLMAWICLVIFWIANDDEPPSGGT